MANSKKQKRVGLGDGGGAPEPDHRTPMERAAEKEETAILDLLNSEQVNDAVIELKRRGVAQTIFAHLAEIPAKGFSQENVKRIFGGGDYKARVRFAKSGNFGPQFDFTIDHSIPSIYPSLAKAAETQREDRTPEVIAAMTAALKSALPATPAPDNSLLMELIKQQGAQMTALLMARNAQPDPALAELRAEIRALKESGGGGNKRGRLRDEIEDMMAIMELTGGRGGDGPAEKPDRIIELIRALGPAGGALVQRLLGGGAAPEQPNGAQPLLAAGSVDQRAQTITHNPTTQTEDMSFIFNLFLPEFKRVAVIAATKGRDAFEWVDDKLDELDPKYHAPIFQLANAEDWFAKIFGGDATANAHVAWLLEMRNAILTRFFIADVTTAAAATPRPEPAAYAKGFLDRVSVSYHETLWESLEPGDWNVIFSNSAIDSVWLEKVRAAFEDEMSDDDDEPAPAPTPAAEPPPVSPSARRAPAASRVKSRAAKPKGKK